MVKLILLRVLAEIRRYAAAADGDKHVQRFEYLSGEKKGPRDVCVV